MRQTGSSATRSRIAASPTAALRIMPTSFSVPGTDDPGTFASIELPCLEPRPSRNDRRRAGGFRHPGRGACRLRHPPVRTRGRSGPARRRAAAGVRATAPAKTSRRPRWCDRRRTGRFGSVAAVGTRPLTAAAVRRLALGPDTLRTSRARSRRARRYASRARHGQSPPGEEPRPAQWRCSCDA
jgi:hypothetical protein